MTLDPKAIVLTFDERHPLSRDKICVSQVNKVLDEMEMWLAWYVREFPKYTVQALLFRLQQARREGGPMTTETDPDDGLELCSEVEARLQAPAGELITAAEMREKLMLTATFAPETRADLYPECPCDCHQDEREILRDRALRDHERPTYGTPCECNGTGKIAVALEPLVLWLAGLEIVYDTHHDFEVGDNNYGTCIHCGMKTQSAASDGEPCGTRPRFGALRRFCEYAIAKHTPGRGLTPEAVAARVHFHTMGGCGCQSRGWFPVPTLEALTEAMPMWWFLQKTPTGGRVWEEDRCMKVLAEGPSLEHAIALAITASELPEEAT